MDTTPGYLCRANIDLKLSTTEAEEYEAASASFSTNAGSRQPRLTQIYNEPAVYHHAYLYWGYRSHALHVETFANQFEEKQGVDNKRGGNDIDMTFQCVKLEEVKTVRHLDVQK